MWRPQGKPAEPIRSVAVDQDPERDWTSVKRVVTDLLHRHGLLGFDARIALEAASAGSRPEYIDAPKRRDMGRPFQLVQADVTRIDRGTTVAQAHFGPVFPLPGEDMPSRDELQLDDAVLVDVRFIDRFSGGMVSMFQYDGYRIELIVERAPVPVLVSTSAQVAW